MSLKTGGMVVKGYLPTTATSGKSSGGNDAGVLAPAKNDVKGN